MYILYGGKFTRALIVQMVLQEGGIPYELREVDILNDGHRSEKFLKLNPAGLVPILLTPDDGMLYETPAINLYLVDRHRLDVLGPGVDDPARGLFLSGLFYITDELEPAMKRYFYPHRYVTRPDDCDAMKTHSLGDAMIRLGVIEKRLSAKGPFHLGERFSLVDLTLSYWTAYFDQSPAFDDYPALRQCVNLVAQRPAIRPLLDQIVTMRKEYAVLQARGEGVN